MFISYGMFRECGGVEGENKEEEKYRNELLLDGDLCLIG